MKKLLLPLIAFMLSATAVTAQKKAPFTFKALAGTAKMEAQAPVLKSLDKQKVAKAPMKALAENQKYMGPFEGDELNYQDGGGLGLPTAPGKLKVAALLDPSYVAKFNGGKVVAIRFGLAYAAGSCRVFMLPVDGEGNVADADAVSQNKAGTKYGWNTVNLTKPYTISADGTSTFLLGFEYTQKNTNDGQSYNNECYPLNTGGTGYDGGFFCYGKLSQQGTGWYNMGSQYGCIAVQAIVEKDGGFDVIDAVMDGVMVNPYVKKGGTGVVTFGAHCFGKEISNAVFGIKVNGSEVASVTAPEALTSETKAFQAQVKLPEDLKYQDNELSVYVKSLEGAAPTEYTADDESKATFKAFTDTVAHQKNLLEHFTSQYCTYCPLGYDVLNKLMELRNDLAWVSIHGDMGGTDVYTLDDGKYISEFTGGSYTTGGIPRAALNRYYEPAAASDAWLAYNLGYRDATTGAKILSAVVDASKVSVPAFASVNIASNYDKATKKLTVKVSGDAVSDFADVFGSDAVLTVYLTENGLVSKQLNQGTWIQEYPHNHVLRAILTEPLGDAVTWSGNKFENDYNVTLDNDWNADNMDIVAFISRPIKMQGNQYTTAADDAYVTNTNMVKLGSSTTGINGVNAGIDTSATEVARYTVDGRRVSAPVKGLNIVKMSDGRTMKVIVK